MNIVKNAEEISQLVNSLGWHVEETRIATTGSVYITAYRQNEWITIRIADHKQVYFKWLTTYSVAPSDLWFEDLEEILKKPYGEVGDIL